MYDLAINKGDNMQRMTKISAENLKVADFIKIELFQGGPSCMVSVWRNGNVSYLHGSDQSPMLYPSMVAARRSVKRIRPDLEPTQI